MLDANKKAHQGWYKETRCRTTYSAALYCSPFYARKSISYQGLHCERLTGVIMIMSTQVMDHTILYFVQVSKYFSRSNKDREYAQKVEETLLGHLTQYTSAFKSNLRTEEFAIRLVNYELIRDGIIQHLRKLKS